MQISNARSGARILGLALAALAIAVPAALRRKAKDQHVQLLAINDLHGHLAPNTPGTVQTGCCNEVTATSGCRRLDAEDRAGGRHRLPRHAHQGRCAPTTEHLHRRRGRHDRRQPARLGALPRRADRRGAELDRLRRHRRGQPRVRRGRRRAAAHAVRQPARRQRLPPRRRLPGRARRSRARCTSTWPRTSSSPARTRRSSRPTRSRRSATRRSRFIGMTFEATPTVVTPSGVAGPRVPRRGRDRQRARDEAQARAEASSRSSCCSTRAARSGRRRRRLTRRRRRPATSTRTSTSA